MTTLRARPSRCSRFVASASARSNDAGPKTARRPALSKYDKLQDYLIAPGPESRRLRFAEIEKILGFALPRSTRNHPAWWANDPNPNRHSNAWLAAGWETKDVDLGGEAVTFRRAQNAAKVLRRQTTSRSRPDRAASPDMVEDLPDAPEGDVRIAIAMQWKRLGVVVIDEGDKLSFPAAPQLPALYRLRLIGTDGVRHYIGEAVNLRRRFGTGRTRRPINRLPAPRVRVTGGPAG
ncbi:hypothetical protein AAFN47_26230 [Hoeflea sp. CAU 1731]